MEDYEKTDINEELQLIADRKVYKCVPGERHGYKQDAVKSQHNTSRFNSTLF